MIFPAVLVKEEKVQIAQKRQELEQVKNNIEAIMNQCAG
jgi:vacuolar-type H+-ATPase subunit I/STV1